MTERRPCLDNIETAPQSADISKAKHIKASEPSSSEKLYNFDELDSLHKYKTLSRETAVALYDFGSDVLFRERAENMMTCGNRVGFDNDRKIVSANFCRQRLCPLCQRRRSLKIYGDFKRLLSHLSDFVFLHLVLTVPNCAADELSGTLNIMQQLSTRLFKLPALKRAFKGIARCTEVSYNSKLCNFHPHFHCLIAVNSSYCTSRDYVRYKDIRRWWSALWLLRDEPRIERITDTQIFGVAEQLNNKDLLQIFITVADDDVLPEIAKYAVKPLELKLNRTERAKALEGLFCGLHGRRLIQTYGVINQAFKDLKIDLNAEPDEPAVKEKYAVYDWIYVPSLKDYRYRKSKDG